MRVIMGWRRDGGAVFVCIALWICFSTNSWAGGGVTNLTNGGTINFSCLVGSKALSVQVGDKLFSDFSFQYTDTDMNNGNDLKPSALVLSSLANQVGFGLSIQLPLIATGSTTKDIVLRFSTTVLDANNLISDVHLNFTSSVSGHGIASVSENIFTNGFGAGQIGPTLFVQNPGHPAIFEDSAFLSVPQHKIWVQKDILVDANGTCNTDWSLISIVDQTFSQIPEPSTMVLSVIGLAACLFMKRRH